MSKSLLVAFSHIILLLLVAVGCEYQSVQPVQPVQHYQPVKQRQFSCEYIYNQEEFHQCTSRANSGDAIAAFGVAEIHNKGIVFFGSGSVDSLKVKRDKRTAFHYYKLAADLGHEKALRIVFDSYYLGKLGTENKELAQLYLKKAANAKCEWAMLLSAQWSEDNDPEKAINLYLEAAREDNAHAQNRLAEIYFDGKIVPQDICESYFWALLARAGGPNRRSKTHWLFYSKLSSLSAHLSSIRWSDADRVYEKRAYANAKRIKARTERALDSEHVQLVQNSATVWQKGQIEPEFPIIQIEQTKEPTFVKISPPESMTISKSLTTDISIEWVAAAIDLNSQLKKELTSAQIFDLINPSVWTVISASTIENLKAMNNISQGSAVAISKNMLLTNYHVIDKRPYVLIKHGEQFAEAVIYAGDKQSDRCILITESIELKPVKGFIKYNQLSVGSTVYSVGSPQGLENSLGHGIISGKRELDEQKIIQTTAQVSPGSSGGGLFDSYGNLIGITTFKVIDSEGLNFAIPVEDFTR